MKHLFYIFIMTITLGCSGQTKKESSTTPIVVNDSIMSAHGYDVVELQKMETGHLTATFNINGKPCVFLVDTGGGGTLIDLSKKDKYELKAIAKRNYAAGIGSASSLVKTSAIFQINGKEIKSDKLFLMDISYLNTELKKTKGRPVDGVLGTDFLEQHKAVIDYPHSKLYLIIEPDK